MTISSTSTRYHWTHFSLDQLINHHSFRSRLTRLLKLAFLQVNCGEPKEDSEDTNQRGDTSVSVQLFDSPPINITVSGDLPWTDPKFSEVVAQKALDRYKETSV